MHSRIGENLFITYYLIIFPKLYLSVQVLFVPVWTSSPIWWRELHAMAAHTTRISPVSPVTVSMDPRTFSAGQMEHGVIRSQNVSVRSMFYFVKLSWYILDYFIRNRHMPCKVLSHRIILFLIVHQFIGLVRNAKVRKYNV